MVEGRCFDHFSKSLDGFNGVSEVFVAGHEEGSVVAVLVSVEEHVGDEHHVDAFLEGCAVVLSEGQGFDFDAQVM